MRIALIVLHEPTEADLARAERLRMGGNEVILLRDGDEKIRGLEMVDAWIGEVGEVSAEELGRLSRPMDTWYAPPVRPVPVRPVRRAPAQWKRERGGR